MAELLRTFAGRLRAVVANRRSAPRKRLRLSCSVSLHDPNKAHATAQRRAPALECHTCDLSASGIGLIAPAIRVGGRYLTDSALVVRIEHTTGPIEIVARSVRYEQLPPEGAETGYLIGVHITSMSAEDRARYDELLR